MSKNRDGFSYLEIIIATTIFSVLVLAVLPLVGQARRNLAYAEAGYGAHLAAQNIMYAVRDSGSVFAGAGYAESFSVWIFGGDTAFFATPCAPGISAWIGGDTAFFGDTRTVVVAVWRELPCGEMQIGGRAVGFIQCDL